MKKSQRLSTIYSLLSTKRRVFVLAFSLPIILLVGAALFFSLHHASPALAAWFDDAWAYRTKYPITNSSGSTQTDFQTMLTVDTATLISAGKMLSTCNDVRITDINGKTMPIWIEPTTCNTASTKIWAKVPNIYTSGSDIYLYYGNPTASAASSTSSTFIRDMASAAVSWPLDDTTTTQSYSRVTNPALATGRNITINGTFDTDTIWVKDSNATISGGTLNLTASNGLTYETGPIVTGKAYQVTFTISNYSSGSVKAYIAAGQGTARSANGTYTETIIAGSSTSFAIGMNPTTFTGNIDAVSVTQLSIPDSSATPTQILVDGNMEAAGTTAWISFQGATLSKQATSPHGGTQVIRATYNGVASPGARQNILTIGQTYRVSGYARSDGVNAPRVWTAGSAIALFIGTTSTTWQPFDVVFVATATDLEFAIGGGGSGNYSEWDDVVVSLDTGIRSDDILSSVDGNMEASGTTFWSAGGGGVITKQTTSPHGGSQVLRVTMSGGNNPTATQSLLVLGKTYRISGYTRSDGNAIPQFFYINGASVATIGTTSTSWQYFEQTFVANSSTNIALRAGTSTVGQYVEFDDVSLTELDPLVGIPTNGVTLGSTANGHVVNAYTFDGSNDVVNTYSSDLNSVFNPNQGSLITWSKVSGSGVWTDATFRYIARIRVDANNDIQVFKSSTNNRISVSYTAGGTVNTSSNDSQSDSGWVQWVITWDKTADQVKVYKNGVQQGSTLTGLGTWVGNLSSSATTIGASGSSGTLPWSGMINDVRLYTRALSPAEISDQYSSGSDIQTYTTSNYTGQELLRKYNASITLGSAATEERGGAPAAYWRLDEGTGTTSSDQTTNSNTATLTNGPTWTAEDQCIAGKCLFFDGSNDRIDVPNSSSLALGTGSGKSWTVSLWYKRASTSTSAMSILGKREGSSSSTTDYLFFTSGNQLTWGTGASGDTCAWMTITEPSTNAWHHLSGTLTQTGSTSGTKALYVDGNLVSSCSYSSKAASGTAPLHIGASDDPTPGNFFKGYIDEPKIYPYARSAAQVKADFDARETNEGVSAQIGNSQKLLSDGLVGYWKMDESSGNASDSSGNGNTFTNTSTVTYGAGKFGNAGVFDGSTNYFTQTPTAAVTNVTIAGWINASGALTGSKGAVYETHSGYGLRIVGSKLTMAITTTNNTFTQVGTSNTTLSTGTWYHVAATYDGTTIRFYLNGVADGTSTAVSGDLSGGVGNRYIDRDTNNTKFPGSIDEVRVYNRALPAPEIRAVYGFAPGPVGYWKMDEKNGTSALDSSGNSNAGTLTNSPLWTQGKSGGGLSFGGASGNKTVRLSTNALAGYKAFTLSTWAFGDTLTAGAFFGTNGGGPYWRSTSGTNLLLHMMPASCTGSSAWSLNSVISAGWHHYSVTIDGNGNMNFYKDGVLFSSTTFLTTYGVAWDSVCVTSNHWTDIGNYAGSSAWTGTLDEFKIYNYARTQQQIVEDMQGGRSDSTMTGSVLPQPIGYWRFDEGQGTIANNAGIGSIPGTITNMAAPATGTSGWNLAGKIGKALNFDGSNDYVSMGTNSALNVVGGDFTISTWVKTTQTGSSLFILQKGSGPAFASDKGFSFCLCNSGTTWSFQLWDATSSHAIGAHSPTNLVATNAWTHLIGVYTAATKTGTLYVNGKVAATSTNTNYAAPDLSANNFIIGASSTPNVYWQGSIDEVKVYNSALSPEQALQEYNAGAALTLGSVNAATESATLTDGAGAPPVAYWNLDEKAGTTTSDTSGNNNTGTLTNGPLWTQGKYGSAVSFDGTDDYISVPSWVTPTTGITLEAWIKTNVNGLSKGIVSKGASANNWLLYLNSTNVIGANIFATGNVSICSLTGTKTISTGIWYHVTATYDGATCRLYVNGVLDASTSGTGTIAANGGINSIGNDSANSNKFWNGTIDDVKIYSYPRTQSQIMYDYNRGLPLAWWRMDECQGSSINDATGNGNTGTLTIGASGTQTSAGTCNTTSTAWGNGAAGKFNGSVNFDGTDDYVSVSTPAGLPTGSQPFTLSAWIKPTSYGTFGIIGYGSYGVGDAVNALRLDGSGSLRHYFWGDDLDCPVSGLTDGNWHLVNVTWDNTTSPKRAIYVDGRRRCTTSSGSPNTVGTTVTIGRTNTVEYFPGGIDDARIYNYALSPIQIRQLYNNGASAFFGPVTGQP